MAEKLKEYKVLDVLCGGTFYKVRHKVTNNIFAWRAHNCSAYSDQQIKTLVNEVKVVRKLSAENVLRYYDTILHAPSKTLYFVLEYDSGRTVEEIIALSEATGKCFVENFIWRLLLELARAASAVHSLRLVVLQKCITTASIYLWENGEVRVNCFQLNHIGRGGDLMRDVGEVVRAICFPNAAADNVAHFRYSDDLRDVVNFLTDDKNVNLRPDVLLYHPTVLANVESASGATHWNSILVSVQCSSVSANVNKCDSEKAVELCRAVEPLPRTYVPIQESPIYSNMSPNRKTNKEIERANLSRESLSPTLAALALELPGFVPRCRRAIAQSTRSICPQKVSEDTLSQQWMSRLIALRKREESLNKRERNLIAKEIVSSPATKIISLDTSGEVVGDEGSNGITLPPLVKEVIEEGRWVSRRRQRRSSSTRSRGRRKSYAYEDLDSSLSADPGDGSIVITATKFTHENMPRRNIFPDVATKKVHFTPSNPFVESDESVTLTFYELENVDNEGYQVPQRKERALKDISKFKYIDVEKVVSEKRAAAHWNHSSPSKHAKVSKDIFNDITNSLRKTPSKSSLISKDSNTSKCSVTSLKSQWSTDKSSERSEGGVSHRTRSSTRQSLAFTPSAPPDSKKSKRKSLLHFKTPFRFMSSTKN